MEAGIEEGLERGIKQGIENGIEQGIEQGANKNKLEIAKRMKEKKVAVIDIMDITGLTEKEIENL